MEYVTPSDRSRSHGRRYNANSRRTSGVRRRRKGFPGNAVSTRGNASSNRIRDSSGWMERKSWRRESLAISANAPASSTPVGPAPTITKVSQRRRSLGISLSLGGLEGVKDLWRIRVASSSDFRPGARGSQEIVAEVEMPRSGSDDQRVVRDRRSFVQDQAATGPGRDRRHRRAAPGRSSVCATEPAAARRFLQETARPWRLDTTRAETGGSSGGRASVTERFSCRSARAA